MRTYSRIALGALALSSALTVVSLCGTFTARPAYAICMPGDRIDGTTANDALRRFSAAGYPSVHDLKKGCDNYWHGVAVRDGNQIRVVLAPSGQVLQEGD